MDQNKPRQHHPVWGVPRSACFEVDTDLHALRGLDREADALRQRGPCARDPHGPQAGWHSVVPPASRRFRAVRPTADHRWIALPRPPAERAMP